MKILQATIANGEALSDNDKLVLQEAVDSQTWFDQIISIEATTPPEEHPLMYDLTVATKKLQYLQYNCKLRHISS
jgi:hypothetical protein